MGLKFSRLVVYAGHYGSGKTTLAIQTALDLRARGKRVLLADLDIVNPYFRTHDHRARLEAAGVRLIVSAYAGTNAELPGFPPEAAAAFDDAEACAVFDVGGDDRGALALGRYAARLNAEAPAVLMVVNAYRPLTARPEQVAEIRQEIERASRVRFTGLVNNSNLGAGTTARDVLDTCRYIQRAGEATGLPLAFTAAKAGVAEGLDGPVMAIG